MLKNIFQEKGLSVYRVSKDTGIAYTTLNDLVIEKTDIGKTSVDTLYRLATYLELSMEYLYTSSRQKDINKSNKTSENFIGIWWWTGKKIIGVKTVKENGSNIDGLIHYSDTENHITLWKKLVKENYPEKEWKNVYDKGFKSLYRGRVYFDPRTACYEITCSKNIINDNAFRKKVLDFYNLNDARKEFVALHHYENIRELTGNAAVDADYFESSF